jgi:hypothetical protein
MLIKITKGLAECNENDFTTEGTQYLCWFKGYFYYQSCFYFSKEACLLLEKVIHDNNRDTVKEMNGIFLCILLDKQNKRLYIINDRFGFHQLFYLLGDEQAFIGDNFWEISEHSKIHSLDRVSLLEMMQYRFVSGKYTLAENIFCIEPSSIYELDYKEKIRLTRDIYWHFNYNPQPISLAEAEVKIYNCLDSIISKYNQYLFGDKLIGINLTGGLDTRYILALLLKKGVDKNRIKSFTYGSPTSEDIRFAREVATECEIEHTPLLFTEDFKDFFLENQMDQMLREIGFYSYYFPAYGVLRAIPHYCKIDYLLSGYDGFYMGLKATPALFNIEDDEALLSYIYSMNATIFSTNQCQSLLSHSENQIKEKLIERIKENIEGESNYVSAFFDWTLKNRNRKYLLGVYNLQNINTTHLLSFYDYDFIDLMASLPFDMLYGEKSYINSMFRIAFTGRLETLAAIPVEKRGIFKKAEGNFVAQKRSKYTLQKLINKMLNGYDRDYAYPIRQQLAKKHIFRAIIEMVQKNKSEQLNSFEIIKLIKKKRRSEYFTRYGLLVILSILRFENLLKKSKL